jgi:hypothetical protein
MPALLFLTVIRFLLPRQLGLSLQKKSDWSQCLQQLQTLLASIDGLRWHRSTWNMALN